MKNKERRTLVITSLAHNATHILMMAFPSIMPTLAGGGYLIQTLGRMNFFHRLAFGTMVFPAGFLVDRIGPKRVLALSLFGGGSAAIAVSLLGGGRFLTLALILLGSFAGLYHSCGIAALSYRERGRGISFGIHGSAGTLGVVITPALCAVIITGFHSWRPAYIIFAVYALALGIVVSAIPARWKPPKEDTFERGGAKVSVSKLARFLPTYLIFGLAYTGFVSFLILLLAKRLGVESAWAGFWATACLVVGVPGQWVGGILADRFNPERLWSYVLALSTPALFGLWCLRGPWLLISAASFSFLFMAAQPINNTLFSYYAHPSHRGRVYGLGFLLYFGAGSLYSEIGGIIGERWGIETVFLPLAALTFLAALIAGIGRIGKRGSNGCDQCASRARR